MGVGVLGYIFLVEKESKGPSTVIANHHDRKCRDFAGIFNPITAARVVGKIANLPIFSLADINEVKVSETVDKGNGQAYTT